VLGVLAHGGVFDRLADGDAERAVALGVLREQRAARIRVLARARDDGAAPDAHHRAPVRLLVVRNAHHVHLRFDTEDAAGEGERRSPLARARLRRDALHAFLLVVVRLRDRGVRLVRTGGRDAFVLVVDLRRRIERLFEARRTDQGRWPPDAVDLADLIRDGDV